MTKKHPEPLRGKLSRNELKRRSSVLRTPNFQIPIEKDKYWHDLLSSMAVGFIQGIEEDILSVGILFRPRATGEDWESLRKIFAKYLNSYLEMLVPDTITRDLFDFLVKQKHGAEHSVRRRLKTPIYKRRWKSIGFDIIEKLAGDYPEINWEDSFWTKIVAILPSIVQAVLSEQIKEKTKISERTLSFDKMVELKIMQRLDAKLPKDILGDNWRTGRKKETIAREQNRIELLSESKKSIEAREAENRNRQEFEDLTEAFFQGAKLSKQQKDIFWMKYDGHRPAKIAESLGTTSNVISVQLHRAKAKIKNTYGGKASIRALISGKN